MSLTNGNWYTAKLTVDDDGSGGDRLRFWVDTDGDSTWSDEAEHFADTSVIDAWPAGYVGLFVAGSGAATEFDDVTMWMDTDADGTIDEQQFADDFDSNQVTLTYDDNGNLTSDGVFSYVYDGWNRLRKVQRVAAGPTTTVASYAYFADNRRSEKIVQNSGAEVVENDGGDTTVRFYYGGINPAGSRWNILETRNGSNQATFQYVWGTQYVDELVLIDKNLAPTVDSDSDPDVISTAENTDGDSPDGRYLVHQDRNWNVIALTDYDPDGTGEGAVVERYSYTPYGEVTVLNGVGAASSEFGNVRLVPSVPSFLHHRTVDTLAQSTLVRNVLATSVSDPLNPPDSCCPEEGQSCCGTMVSVGPQFTFSHEVFGVHISKNREPYCKCQRTTVRDETWFCYCIEDDEVTSTGLCHKYKILPFEQWEISNPDRMDCTRACILSISE